MKMKALATQLKAEGKKVISFTVGEPDFDTPRHIVDACIKALNEGKTKYIDAPGLPELREAIAEKSVRENRIPCEKAHVLVTPTKHALFESIFATVNPGEEVIVPDPAWVSDIPFVLMSDLLDEVTTRAGIFKGGEMTFAAPLSSKDVYEFPQPIGKLQVFNTDHEEVFLMSKLIKGVKDVDFRIAIDEQFVNVVKTLHMVGMDRKDKIDVRGVKVAPIDVLTTLMPRPTDFIGKVKGYAGIVVETTGMKEGKKTMVKMSLMLSHERAHEISNSNATGYLVGIGGAIGTEMLLEGEIPQKGVVFPEMVDADRFLERLRAKGLEVKEQRIAL